MPQKNTYFCRVLSNFRTNTEWACLTICCILWYIKIMDSANEKHKILETVKNGEPCLEKFYRAAYGYMRFVAYSI